MKRVLMVLAAIAVLFGLVACGPNVQAKSDTGVTKITAKVAVGPDGLTVEQKNVSDRLEQENQIGSIKHLYVISPYSGQVMMYFTVKGKITSSGKRLSPSTVSGSSSGYYMPVVIDGKQYYTQEVLGDDGTYGGSIEYLYFWDVQGVYHQQYVQSCILHISSKPLAGVHGTIINIEEAK
jgi:hypothetical protein